MKIGALDTHERVIIIAEIGNNHEGDLKLAQQMIRAAAAAGADAVKFQAIDPSKLVSHRDAARLAQLEKFRLKPQQFEGLSRVARDEGVLFLCTPFSLEAVHFLDPLVPAFKIASGDNNFFPLLDAVAKTGKPILLSGGLADLKDLEASKNYMEGIWKEQKISQELAILHCVVSYPTAPEEANLLAIRDIAKLNTTVGYSDHTIGIQAAVLAVALGARIIEKHFTLDKNLSDFRDHKIAADPQELAALVQAVHEAQRYLGNGVKKASKSEEVMRTLVRRSIVAKRDLPQGKVLGWEDFNWVRFGDGIAPGHENKILGKILRCPVAKGDKILFTDLQDPNGR